MKFLEKISIVLLMGTFLLPSIFLKPLEVEAAGSMEIISGNVEFNEQTNMVVKITLGADFACGQWMDIYFANNIMSPVFTANDVNVMHVDGGGAGVDISAYMDFHAGSTTASSIGFDHNAPGCSTIPAGDTIAFYFGPADDLDAGYATGEPDYFNVSAVNTITNHSGLDEEIVYTNSGTVDHANIQGSYPVSASDPTDIIVGRLADVSLGGEIDPYIQLVLGSTSATLPIEGADMQTANLSVQMASNAKSGHRLRYRSTALEDITDPLVYFPAANETVLAPGTSAWGLAAYVSSSTGATTFVPTSYLTDGDFTVDTSGDFSDLLFVDTGSPGPATSDSVVMIRVASSAVQPPGQYQAIITFNMYASF